MKPSKLRNLFDQYHQPENQVTNALLQTLETSDKLKKEFFETFVGIKLNRNSKLTLECQKIPGGDEDKPNPKGSVPDGLITDAEHSIAVAIESKMGRDAINEKQITEHLKGIKGYETQRLLVITPDAVRPEKLSDSDFDKEKILWHSWQEIYEWIKQETQKLSQDNDSATKYLLENLGGFMRDQNVIGFDGFRNLKDDKETKNNFKVLCDEINAWIKTIKEYEDFVQGQDKTDLWRVFSKGNREIIFSDEGDSKEVLRKGYHTRSPHFTLGVNNKEKKQFSIALYVPHRAGENWSRLEKIFTPDEEEQKFKELLHDLRKHVPLIELEFIHRHAEVGQPLLENPDGHIYFDIDTADFVDSSQRHKHFKKFPCWFSAMEALVRNKGESNANIQFGVVVRYRFGDVDGKSNKKLLEEKEFMEEAKKVIAKFKELYEFFL